VIHFKRHKLDNGLRVLIHEDKSTPMVAVNLLYNVGARDESPEKTGFAHLFEHLMFSGSKNVSNFDDLIQSAGGDCNAFTNHDITNYYEVLPAHNLEVALWLEADRMQFLDVSERALDIQRKVVVEEFKETCLNQPYGDVWHHLSELSYKVHPYRWPTIGLVPEHVENARLEEVRHFFEKYYQPGNAILVIAGNVEEKEALSKVEKWFGPIRGRAVQARKLPQEPPQKTPRCLDRTANVPLDALYMTFRSPDRSGKEYYVADLISDILANGSSARLYRRLLKEQRLFTQIDAYISGTIDPGLFVVEGRPAADISLEEAEKAIWKELTLLKEELLSERELQKLKYKVETTVSFSESNVLNKAINLAFYELLGDPGIINREVEIYHTITSEDIRDLARKMFTPEGCSTLFYRSASTS
jgi:zinc protease